MADSDEMANRAQAAQSAVAATFVDAIPDAALVVDAQLRIIAANPAAVALGPRAQPGTPLHHTIRSPDVLGAAGRVIEHGNAERTTWHQRVPIEQMFEVNVAPLNLANGRLVMLILRNVSDALRVERMRVDFIANASHELRTPLASLLGFVETLQGPAKNDAAAREKFLAIMAEQGRRMARLLDDLLQLSRIEQVQHVRPMEPVDFAGVVRHVADTLAPVAKDARVDLRVDAPARLDIPGARDELIRLAENLIENAIKYGSDSALADPRVEIGLTVSENDVLLSVRDHGPGIPHEHLPRLTERFYRVDAPASRAKGGTGLGLAIVKHIIARHRGRLVINSTEGEGSEFLVTLPLNAD